MDLPVDDNGRYVIEDGPEYAVVCAVKLDGSSPAREALEALEQGQKNVLNVLFQKARAAAGYKRLESLPFLQHERGKILTFKLRGENYRAPYFRDGRCLVITHGFFKPKQKWRKQQFDRAERIMAEDIERLNKRKQRKKQPKKR